MHTKTTCSGTLETIAVYADNFHMHTYECHYETDDITTTVLHLYSHIYTLDVF